MPYIDSAAKQRIDRGAAPITVGELTYVIDAAMIDFVKRSVPGGTLFFNEGVPLHDLDGLRYAHLAEVMAAVENAKLEFYRRVVAPFEDQKIKDNGDVFVVEKEILR